MAPGGGRGVGSAIGIVDQGLRTGHMPGILDRG